MDAVLPWLMFGVALTELIVQIIDVIRKGKDK